MKKKATACKATRKVSQKENKYGARKQEGITKASRKGHCGRKRAQIRGGNTGRKGCENRRLRKDPAKKTNNELSARAAQDAANLNRGAPGHQRCQQGQQQTASRCSGSRGAERPGRRSLLAWPTRGCSRSCGKSGKQ
eukprot:5631149-Pleurochrysis_carterae.AAC.5